ncbi:MAG TPA: glutamate racemase [Terriglobales bacterium]|nr:glutamate racemase [Terriglobales bacterium]
MTARHPVLGVFDSGFGGLTVLEALRRRIPEADFLYFGDTARLPYGTKSAETVARYAIAAARFLEDRGAEMLVVACNTASALALEPITRAMRIGVVGVVAPGAERAARASRSRKAVVIATEATVASHAYRTVLATHGVQAYEKACPLLVPLVEEGWTEHPVTEQVARIYLEEAFGDESRGADVLLLGCTHYPLLQPLIARVLAGVPADSVAIVDSADSTADVVAQALRVHPLPPPSPEPERRNAPRVKCFATDSVEKFRRIGERFVGHRLEDVTHVDLGG